MARAQEKRRAELVTAAFDLLACHTDGLPIESLLERIEREYPLGENEKVPNRYHGFKPFEELILTGMIPLISAEWVVETDGIWRVTREGDGARGVCSTPEEFYRSVAGESFKSWLVVHFPRVFAVLSRLLSQYHIEIKTLGRLGWPLILKSVAGGRPAWQRALPVQKALRYELPDLTIQDYGTLERYLKSSGLQYDNAGHTFYLPPRSARLSSFAGVMKSYPADAGLKILKRRGTAGAAYLFGDIRNRRISIWYNYITYSRDLLCVVANLFYSRGIGARIYDLIEMDCGGHIWSAYVVEHVSGRMPSPSECQAGIDEIKRLEKEGLLKLTLTEGYEDQDLTPPACNNNAFVDAEGRFRYVDFQSFLLVNYQEYLDTLAGPYERALASTARRADIDQRDGDRNPAGEASEFIAHWRLPARFKAISSLLSKADIQLKNRLVLDLNDVDPLTFACFLNEGAAWCHGWAKRELVESCENLLLALGCTRFTLSPVENGAASNPRHSLGLPEFLEHLADGCVLLSSSPCEPAQRSILDRINWSYLISTAPDQDRHPSGCAVKSTASYRDGHGEMRRITVVSNDSANDAIDPSNLALAASSRWATS
ncbi:MAG: hypothetical protein ACREDR_03440 [Blastocatellia bacterium]